MPDVDRMRPLRRHRAAAQQRRDRRTGSRSRTARLRRRARVLRAGCKSVARNHRLPGGGPAMTRITPVPPRAAFGFPWDDPDAPDPVVALTAARAELGDTFVVESGATPYLFVFGEEGLRAFYAIAEHDASKGLADYRMLVRKLPIELFAERRTFAHDLFGAKDFEGYLD